MRNNYKVAYMYPRPNTCACTATQTAYNVLLIRDVVQGACPAEIDIFKRV